MSGKCLSPHAFTHFTLDDRISLQAGLEQGSREGWPRGRKINIPGCTFRCLVDRQADQWLRLLEIQL